MKNSHSKIRQEDIKDMHEFQRELIEGKSVVAKIISVESIRAGSDRIHEAVVDLLVNNGHGVRR